MPASLAAVKRRLESTKNTRQITSAMNMVSTAKLNQIQGHTKTYEVYADQVKSVLVSLVKSHKATLKNGVSDDKDHLGSLFTKRPVKKTGILVVTSDRGLVGSYNSNVIKATLDKMKKNGLTKENTVFLTVGRTGTEFFKKRGMNVVFEATGISDVPTYRETHNIVKNAVQMYADGIYDELLLAYSHYVNRIVSHDRVDLVLPISAESLALEEDNTESKVIGAEYDLEPDLPQLISKLVPQFAESLIYGAILDAKTSEHASSANAMSSASDNADDIISTLQLQYNRARQAAITTEITEITGGMTAQE
ncbi:F0F1 ATP synthase subunit gamma [Lactobacillus sp. 3B(2020)]|uniref:F0F1 ATP synthase subunit gamma n=1 Tax=Lactobacillus sp. 3B(2020) TaxID=2695882 RepID=UPI0015DFE441|nr:F0F1 ATP synthase subunit gamma [Lactobacillus sp. 3B(2020)]QLL69669.1 F0F1 ATP synthase subunit gamma [Lactobacillus sp. 3B(2020)]